MRAGRTRNDGRMYALPPTTRRVIVVVHAIAGVAVIGDVWGLALMHWVALSTGAPGVSRTAFRFTTVMVFGGGIPLSLLSLLSGLTLVLFGKWSLRQTWVWIKLVLQLSILATGALFIRPILLGPQQTADLVRNHEEFLVLLAVQATSLIVATTLSIFKPGSRRRRTARAASAPAA